MAARAPIPRMANRVYVFHFAADSASPYRLTCGRLAQAILNHAHKAAPGTPLQVDELGPLDPPAALPTIPAAAGNLAADALRDTDLWARAGSLQWTLLSDHALTGDELAWKVEALQAAGQLDAVRSAFRCLIAALVAAYPSLAALDIPELAQLVALGHGMATSAGQSDDFLSFVRSEVQLVDLAVWLGL